MPSSVMSRRDDLLLAGRINSDFLHMTVLAVWTERLLQLFGPDRVLLPVTWSDLSLPLGDHRWGSFKVTEQLHNGFQT